MTKKASCIILIMQRLHENDLVGHVLEQDAWEVVSFPAIAEASNQDQASSGRLTTIRVGVLRTTTQRKGHPRGRLALRAQAGAAGALGCDPFHRLEPRPDIDAEAKQPGDIA